MRMEEDIVFLYIHTSPDTWYMIKVSSSINLIIQVEF